MEFMKNKKSLESIQRGKIEFLKIHKKNKNKIIREFQNPGNKIFEPFHGK
jgi:hypothetical protein